MPARLLLIAIAVAGIPAASWAAALRQERPFAVAAKVASPTDEQAGVPLQPEFWKAATIQEVRRPVRGGGPPAGKTEFAVVHDDEYLFIGVRVTGIDPSTVVANAQAGDLSNPLNLPPEPDLAGDDHVRIILSPLNTTDFVFEARINPRGAVQTVMRTPEHPEGRRWSTLRAGPRSSDKWRPAPAVGRVTADGYEVVLRIHRMRCFLPDWYRSRIEAGESWALNVARASPTSGGPPKMASWTGRLDPLANLTSLEGFGTLVMGPTDIAITAAEFGDGFLGSQPVRATITNLTDKPVAGEVRVEPITAQSRSWVLAPQEGGRGSGTGPGFTRSVALGPRESTLVTGTIDVTQHRYDNRLAVTVKGGSGSQPRWEHRFIGQARLGLHLHESALPTGAPWLDIHLSSDLPADETAGSTVELSLRGAGGTELGAPHSLPLAGGKHEIGYDLPPLAPGKYALHGRLVSEDGHEQGTAWAAFVIEPPRSPKPQQPTAVTTTGTATLALRDLSGEGVSAWPLTFGVPFPDGLVSGADMLQLVDADGKPVPASIRTAGRWRKSGALKWAHVDLAATSPADGATSLALIYGKPGGGGHSEGRFRVEERDGVLVVTTGPLRFSARQGTGSLIDNVWVDGDGDGTFSTAERIAEAGGGLVATLTHESGLVYTANLTPGGGLEVEESGPASVLLKAEGWFELPRKDPRSPIAERLCRYVIRVRAVEGSPHLNVSHTFVFTGDSKTTRLADIALKTRLVGSPQAADFGIDDVAADAGTAGGESRHVSLLQHADDGWVIFETAAGFDKPLAAGDRAPGFAAVATDRGEVLLGIRDFWQLYPKELEIEGATLVAHIWPAHGKPRRPVSALTDTTLPHLPWVHEGRLLDFQTPEDYRTYAPQKPASSHEASVFQDNAFETNALGLAKTHELTLSFSGRPRAPQERKAIGRVIQEPPVCAAAPAWMCDSGAFGAVKLHPVDRERFPRIEAALEGQFDAENRLTERVRAYGMFNYLDTHTWYYFELGRLYWWRVWANTHHGGPRAAWLLYARSGDPKYLRAAHRRAMHHMEIDMVHHDTPYVRYRAYPHAKLKGALTDYKGFVHWNSGNRLYDYNSMADYLFYDWYLTGNRRGLDVARLFADAVLDTPAVGGGTDRNGAGVTSALCSLYEETGDERLRTYVEQAGKQMISVQQPDGFFPTFWTTYAPWRGQYIRATDGDPQAIDSLRRWCDDVVEWRYCDGDNYVASRPSDHEYPNLDTFPMAEDLASGWFLAGGNPDWLRLGLGDLESFSWGMYEGDEHPEYRGFNGIWGNAITLTGYVLQTAPYLMRAVAEHGKPVEPLFRRSLVTTAEGVTAYLDLPEETAIDLTTMIHLQPDGGYELRLSGPGGETLPPVPLTVEARQPQQIRWTSPKPLAAGEWKLVLAGTKPTTLVRLDVPQAKRITYRLPADENAIFRAPAIWFFAPAEPGTMSWKMKSRRGDPNGAVLIDPDGTWAGRTTWLDLDSEKWHDLVADVSAEQAGRPWLLGSRQQRTVLVPSANVPRFFAFDRDDLFLPERP